MDKRVELHSLTAFVVNAFMACGLSEADSRVAADVLTFADQRGIRSHGVANLERIYLKGIRLGKMDPAASAQLVNDDQATALLDGNSGVGLVIASQAMDLAINKARQYGAGIVAVRNSSHFGAAGYYTVKAMNAGMIGLATSNLGSQVIARPPEGTLKMLGTNPLSIAAPAASLPSFVLDMSTTAVSTGRIRLAAQRGEPVPTGWLVDDNGHDVTDPALFGEGQAHLQFLGGSVASGGYKGFGLAVAVDVLAGLLAGAAVGPDPNLISDDAPSAHDDQNVGHLLMAIDIGRFRPADQFRHGMDRMLSALLDCPSRPGFGPSVYPGYPEAQSAAQQATTVLLDAADYDALTHVAAELGLEVPSVIESLDSLTEETRRCA